MALAVIGLLVLVSVSSGILGGPPRQADSALASEESPFTQASAGGIPLLSLVLFALAGGAIAVAVVLRWSGKRRRERFFAQLAAT